MLKELMKCIREYKKPSILAPVLVSLEVVMECTIPFLIAMLVNQIKAGAEFSVLVKYGLLLIVMATLSLMFGMEQEMPVQRHPVDLRKMYEKICMQKYRNFHLKISISFQVPHW